MPPGQARDATLRVRVKPATVTRLDTLRGQRSRSEVVREALADWISRRTR